MGDLRLQQVKAHRTRFGTLASNAMSDRFLGIFRHQGFELALGPLVVEEGLAGFSEQKVCGTPDREWLHRAPNRKTEIQPHAKVCKYMFGSKNNLVRI